MAQELTERQRRVLSYIEKYIAEHQVSPSMRDIAQALGFGSTNAVTQFLAILERKGHITRHQPEGVGQAAARSIRLVREEQKTMCAGCKLVKPTPLRRDEMGGYVCLTCINAELTRLRSLIRSAVSGLRVVGTFRYRLGDDPHSLDCCLWARVSRVFLTGSTRAHEICREFGQDPDWQEEYSPSGELLGKATTDGEER